MDLKTAKLKYIAETSEDGLEETFRILCDGEWVDAVHTVGFPTIARPSAAKGGKGDGWEALESLDLSAEECLFRLEKVERHSRRGINTVKTYGIGALGKVVREVRLDEAENLAHVTVSFVP